MVKIFKKFNIIFAIFCLHLISVLASTELALLANKFFSEVLDTEYQDYMTLFFNQYLIHTVKIIKNLETQFLVIHYF